MVLVTGFGSPQVVVVERLRIDFTLWQRPPQIEYGTEDMSSERLMVGHPEAIHVDGLSTHRSVALTSPYQGSGKPGLITPHKSASQPESDQIDPRSQARLWGVIRRHRCEVLTGQPLAR